MVNILRFVEWPENHLTTVILISMNEDIFDLEGIYRDIEFVHIRKVRPIIWLRPHSSQMLSDIEITMPESE